MADAAVLKTVGGNPVRVRVPSSAPRLAQTSRAHHCGGHGMLLFEDRRQVLRDPAVPGRAQRRGPFARTALSAVGLGPARAYSGRV